MTEPRNPDETVQPGTIAETPGDQRDFHANEATLQKAHDDSVPVNPSRPDHQLPEQFGRYRIQRRIGQGAMGAVYLAHDTKLDRQVALKIPKFSIDDGPEAVDRFRREARAMATLRHAHVCPVFDVGESDGTNYLTMAYIEGQPLSAELAEGKTLPNRRAAELLQKIARALQVAHAAGIVHRDIKPANIMIDQHGEPIVMDFGLARRQTEGEASLTHTGAIMGTPAYMAPEQVEGRQDDIGPQTDIYALGVILYQMLSGRLPFAGSTGSVMAKILTETPRRPSLESRDVDPRLESICLKAMAKSTDDRYRSASELATDLSDFLNNSNTATGSIAGKDQAKPMAASPRKRAAVALAAGVLLLAAIGSAALVIGGPWSKDSESPAAGDSPSGDLVSPIAHSQGTLYVLGIGINDYPHEKLRYARVDIAKICETLRRRNPASRPIEVVTLLDAKATRKEIIDQISMLKQKIGKDDLALIAYSGFEHVGGGEFYLLPVDVDMERPSQTGISSTQLYELLPTDVGNVVFLLDTCRSGRVAKFFEQVNPNVTVFASAGADELCYEHGTFGGGLFTSALVAGLEGAADSDGNGLVTLDELAQFIASETARRADSVGLIQNPIVTGRIRPLVLSRASQAD